MVLSGPQNADAHAPPHLFFRHVDRYQQSLSCLAASNTPPSSSADRKEV